MMSTEHGKIAVIGMAGQFPGAKNIDEYWENLLNGTETIKHFKDEELQNFEIDFDNLKSNPNFVPARGILDNIEEFDAHFFGMSPYEASLTDPQHRVWLETVWAAFENAGCNPFGYKGNIGVFAGGYANTYLLNNVLRDTKKLENYIRLRTTESFQIAITNDITHLPTKTAYLFNLKGPAVNIQTACSTSLVAIAQACNSLYSFESDICVAGGICILVPQQSGYIYQEGAIPSPDGHCRPFDEKAQGTVFSNGAGVVVLKRLEDAIKDNDHIYAVVDGWALNNDGNMKVSYTAPSVQGQEEVILMAQTFAGITANEIGYIEAHGTGTNLGDPIEIKALSNAFSRTSSKKQFCGIGSVKSNIGHTDAAAGVASFIKICLSAYHRTIPPTLNFETPNPYINFKDTPFYVNDKLKKWVNDEKLIIGVSSFGIGGTNAHVIIEEPPGKKIVNAIDKTEKIFVLPLSAKSKISLNSRKKQLLDYLSENNSVSLTDINNTLWNGRNHMAFRGALIFDPNSDVAANSANYVEGKVVENIAAYTFMFPGQGAQFVNMGRSLYDENKAFKDIVDNGFSIFENETGYSLKNVVFVDDSTDNAERALTNTSNTQPVLFIFEYAMAKILIDEGITPKYLIGHSIGEFAAAAVAGIFDFETALKVVIKRGQLMQSMPSGTMFALKSSYQTLDKIKSDLFEIAAENAPESCTISFKTGDVEKVKEILDYNDIKYIHLNTSHAFHSEAFDPILDEFAEFVNRCEKNTPTIQVISCLTGDFISDNDAISGSYWAKQLRNTVRFSKGLARIQSLENTLFIEVGPNSHLGSNVKASSAEIHEKTNILTLGRPGNNNKNILQRIKGDIWCCTSREFSDFYSDSTNVKKIPLPTYPFDKKRYWIDAIIPQSDNNVTKNVYSNVRQNSGVSISGQNELTHEISNASGQKTSSTSPITDPVILIQEKLVRIWQELLGIDSIGINDDFFELGGHSLLASTLLLQISNEFGVTIKIQDLRSDSVSVKRISEIITNKADVHVQEKENPKYKILVKKTNELTENEWLIYVNEFNRIFNRNYSKDDLIRKYTVTPLGFSFHSLVYVDNNLVGAQSQIVELFDYKKQVIKVACGVDLFVKEEYRKSFTLLNDLWESADSLLLEYNVKAQIGNPLPDLLAYHEAAQTGWRLISTLSTYLLPLSFKVVHPLLGFLDLFYVPLLQFALTVRSLNKSSVDKVERLFKAHDYYSPYDYATIQEQVGDLKFSWLWSNIKHLKIIIINDNFKSKGDVFAASKYLVKKYRKKAKAITFITSDKLALPFKLFQQRELFIGKVLSDDIDRNEFFNMNNWKFSRGFFD